jgi:hypothetical protein
MRTLRALLGAAILAGWNAALAPQPLHAQSCDFMVTSATWSPNPNPNLINVDFAADMTTDMPLSSDPLNPTQFDMQVNIRFNSVLVDQHVFTLKWWHGITCPANCPPANVCEEKAWSFKGGEVRDQSHCTVPPGGGCGCPKIGDPVVEHKVIPKPSGPGIIDVEIIPLNLSGCNPIRPENNYKQFTYPGKPGGMPAASPQLLVLMAGVLSLTALLTLRRRGSGGLA